MKTNAMRILDMLGIHYEIRDDYVRATKATLGPISRIGGG
jgi:hypothetical protein